MQTSTHENNNATESRTDKAVVCGALLSRLLASAEVERSFGNTHANLLEDAAKEITRLREGLDRIARGVDAPDIDAEGQIQFGLHCGVEDRACADRYEGADYGYASGVEHALEWARNEAEATLDNVKSEPRHGDALTQPQPTIGNQ